MSEQITWTHVDKLVRKMHDERGMLPIGLTDAGVTHDFIKWQERNRDILLAKLEQRDRDIVQLHNQLSALEEKARTPKSKTKQRLSALEAAVEELQDRLERHCV